MLIVGAVVSIDESMLLLILVSSSLTETAESDAQGIIATNFMTRSKSCGDSDVEVCPTGPELDGRDGRLHNNPR